MKGTIVLLLITLSPTGNIGGGIVKEYPSFAACRKEFPAFERQLKRQQYYTATRLIGMCIGYMRKLPAPTRGAMFT